MEMKHRILDDINDPESLEKLYREDKQDFIRSFGEIGEEHDSELIRFWRLRISPEVKMGGAAAWLPDLLAIIVLCVVTGLLVIIPDVFGLKDLESFFIRYLPLILFNGLILYTFWQSKGPVKRDLLFYGPTVFILLLLVSLLPGFGSDSSVISMIHVPLFLWCFFGLSYNSFNYKDLTRRIDFIRFNGELIIMTGLILIAGGILAGMTISLYAVIGVELPEVLIRNAAIIGSGSAPVVSFFLIKRYPNITSRISPVIARVFTPLVLVSLAVYLVSLLVMKSRIIQDRELLLMFNILLIAVMAIIVFSISELDKNKKRDVNVLILLLLALMAILANTIAVIAIVARLTEGLTPNRTIVLISNILIFVNLVLVAARMYQVYFKGVSVESVERVVAKYLTVYFFYTIFAMFIFPLVFGFR